MIRVRYQSWATTSAAVLFVAGARVASAQESPLDSDGIPAPPACTTTTTCVCECDCNCREGVVNVTSYKNLVLFNFGSTLAGRLEFEYERALHRIVSIFGTAYIVAFDSVGNESLIGFGNGVGARVYILGRAPEGLWASWSAGFIHRRARTERAIKIHGVSTGGMIGYTGVWGRFVATFGAGAQFVYGRLRVRGDDVTDKEWNPWFKGGFGVAF